MKRPFLPQMMVIDSELVMRKPSGEDASFFLVTLNEEGEEVERLGMNSIVNAY